ncbi:MAG: hypothetical protein WCC86_10100 [Methanoregula sp.]|uniref:hypothetical protein n=1 Tax=Methanoregula sp. TaxID=2052170 RepID=UPI003BB056F1
MRFLLLTVAGCMLLFCVLFAGCTSPTQAQIQPFSTIVTTQASETTVTVISAEPTTLEPVSPLPPNQGIYLSLTKDRTNGKITLLCNNGPGLIVTQAIEMKITRADGSVVDEFMNNGGEITSGSEIVVQGTLDGTDHAVVWVTSAGKIYKVIDQDISSINPYS